MKTLGIGCVTLCLIFVACDESETQKPPVAKPKAPPKSAVTAAPWHSGSVEQAMADAKKHNRPIFLYWGAVWCPPCNALKAAVFAHPRFSEVVKPFVSVYLDGDTERAQLWGDKLKVSGYPTLLFLDPRGRELLRVSSGLTMRDFEVMTKNVRARMRPLDEIIALAKAGKAQRGDWQLLATIDSYGLKTRGKKPTEIIDTLVWLADSVPAKLVEERAAISGNLLAAAAGNKDDTAKASVAKVQANASRYLKVVLASARSHRAARDTLLYHSAAILGWMYKDRSSPSLWADAKRWLLAARGLRKQQDLPVVTRMDTLWPEIELFRLRTPKGDLPEQLRKRIVATVTADVKKLTTPYLRKAGISDATQLLRKAGALSAARELLDAELKTTTTPWYYMSSYALLEKSAGSNKAALAWARKARLAAKGGATKLQWIANDISMTSALEGDDDNKRMTTLIKAFYDLILQLPDGFFGRNYKRAQRVAKTLKDWLGKQGAAFKPLLTGYAARCVDVAKANQPRCKQHFAQLLAAGQKT